ncbi:MAG: efflux RND transporter periplasmic adaptor subunit [Burkholderiales bacterium]|nr:efflux RND transporter periplasmic adaptor subunit [Burkholderiales bacterium]
MSKNIATLGVVVVVAAAAAGGGYWYGTRHVPLPAVALPGSAAPPKANGGGQAAAGSQAVSVETIKVGTAPMPQTITAVGSLRSDESVTLRPETAGRIKEIAFQEGQRVVKGTPLVRLDSAIPQAEHEQAKANAWLAKTKYERAVDLAKQKFISGQARDEAESNMKVAEAALQLAQAKLAKTEIRAPFSGIIGLRTVSVGDYVKEGADLVNLEAIDPLKVDFRVPEIYLRQVQPGQSLTVTLDAMPGASYDGKVIAVNPLVDAAGRAIVIRAQVRNADTMLRPGMFARVKLITRDQADAVVVPEQALVPQGTERFVFKVVDNKATRVRVETGQRRDAMVEVLSGLSPGDIVVTAGQLKLRDGVPVASVAPRDPKAGPPDVQGMQAPASPAPEASASPIAPANAAPVKSGGLSPRQPKS